MGLRHACRSGESLGKRMFFLHNMSFLLGASQGRCSTHTLNHTGREVCVISLVSFTFPICRWIASEDNAADEPFPSNRHRAHVQDDVDQCGTSTPRAAVDTELLSVLSAEDARMASEEAPPRKHSGTHSCTGFADQIR